jgi:hypothetical protein
LKVIKFVEENGKHAAAMFFNVVIAFTASEIKMTSA